MRKFFYHSNTPEVFTCAQSGCPDCMEQLLQGNWGLIFYVINNTPGLSAVHGELIQEGSIGLWQAALHFDPNRGTSFSTFAVVAIRNRLRLYLHDYERHNSVEQLEGLSEWTQIMWQDAQMRQAIREEVDCLPERWQHVIRFAYGLDDGPQYNMADIGRMMGISRERVRQIRNNALVLLRVRIASLRVHSILGRGNRDSYARSQRLNQLWRRKLRDR